MNDHPDFTIERLGECRIPSPLQVRFTGDAERILYHSHFDEIKRYVEQGREPPTQELGGPREQIYFDPTGISCGIVTCGGLCPGINNVIRGIVLSLVHLYGVRRIYGFRYGFQGLVKRYGHQPMHLTPSVVNDIGEVGGTILASSRGPQDPKEIVDYLEELKISILFTIGGDGTLKGAKAIGEEAQARGSKIGIIGIPKTIDNDISFIQTTFGFETAVSEAQRALYAAHTEALGARNGVGLVKLMGRDSGFISAFAALVNGNVNFCLIPEVNFSLPHFLALLEKRLASRRHAVIAVAEGAGQELLTATGELDASGNVKYGDVGIYLRDTIKKHFKEIGTEITLKYIDPSYIIRSQPANPHDAALCLMLGHHAVHAGMAGRTNMVVDFRNHQFTHVPITLATRNRKRVDPDGLLWTSVLSSTGQPRDMR